MMGTRARRVSEDHFTWPAIASRLVEAYRRAVGPSYERALRWTCAPRHIGRRTAETLMKILMSALACEPGKGSELEVGFQAMLAAARQHDVWVLTNKDTLPAVARAIDDRPERERIHLEGIDFGVGAEGMNLLTIPGFHLVLRPMAAEGRGARHPARSHSEFRRSASCDTRGLLDPRRSGGSGQATGVGSRGRRG